MTQEVKLEGLNEEKVSRWERTKDKERNKVVERPRPRPSCLLIRGPKMEGIPTKVLGQTTLIDCRLGRWEG